MVWHLGLAYIFVVFIGRASIVFYIANWVLIGINAAVGGDIVGLAGVSKATVTDTVCEPSVMEAIPVRLSLSLS